MLTVGTAQSRPKRVYFVEDSAGILQRLSAEVSAIPGVHLAGSADDAAIASKDIATIQPDLVVLDLQLAGGTGIDVLKACRDCAPGTAFVVLTNHSDNITRQRTLGAGADAFFDKSTQFDEFLAHIGTLLSPQPA